MPVMPMAAYCAYQGLEEKLISAPSAPPISEVANRHAAETPQPEPRSRGWSIAHQKRSELTKKQACCAMCQPKLSRARSNSKGACHAHITAACTAVAVTGSVRRRHSD